MNTYKLKITKTNGYKITEVIAETYEIACKKVRNIEHRKLHNKTDDIKNNIKKIELWETH